MTSDGKSHHKLIIKIYYNLIIIFKIDDRCGTSDPLILLKESLNPSPYNVFSMFDEIIRFVLETNMRWEILNLILSMSKLDPSWIKESIEILNIDNHISYYYYSRL